MRPSRARDSAINAITSWPNTGRRAPRLSAPTRQLFGINVFSDEVIKARLPENIYKALRNTIKKGAPLDPTLSDVVAATMREWAMERGATHELPFRWDPHDVRSPGLHRLGSDQPGVYPGQSERPDLVHPHGILFLDG
jgi:hypothetical protein